MLKQEEIDKENSCWNKAKPDELVFILLGRDPAAATTVREWCVERKFLGLNQSTDPKIIEALQWADAVDKLHPEFDSED